jgi:small subunit ribosomal protein S8
MIDPIAEMLTRIRNAQGAGKFEVRIPASKLKLAIAQILEKEGFVESVSEESQEGFKDIVVGLKYFSPSRTKRLPAISGIRRVSKEGQRIYAKSKEIKPVKQRYGISIISTPKGVMTGQDARSNGLGGEVICEVW